MNKKITVKQLINKLSFLDPNMEFDIEPTYYTKNTNESNWVQAIYFDRNLFETIDENGKRDIADFNKVFVPKNNYFKAIYDIIYECDFAHVAKYSNDEYESEVKDIVNLLPQCETVKDIQKMIKNVFTEWFSETLISDNDDLYQCAAELINNIYIIE